MKVQIFWVLTIGCVLGVFARTVMSFGWISIGFLVALAVFLLITAWMGGTRKQPTVLGVIFLIAFALGSVRMHTSIVESEPLLDTQIGSKVTLVGVVANEPDVRENTVRIPVRITMVASSTPERAVSVLVVAPLHIEVAYGDVVRIEGELEVPGAFETSAGRVFEYPGFLAKDGILYTISFAHVERMGENKGFFLKAWAIWLKQKYLAGLAQSLGEPQAGLAGGITVGDKRGLGEELSETFRVVGLTHIVVLSGYNIMVVVDALLRWLVRLPQALRLSFAGSVAFFFAAITGFASASTRAALMAMIAITGKATGRTYLASRALAFVAVGMILWNPYVLVYDPGFQLSILATAGLIIFSPLLEPYLQFVTTRFGLREIASATIGTQVAVLPLLLYQSGQLSIYALPVNLLTLMTIPWAMLFSAIAAVFGLFMGMLAPLFGLPAYALLSYAMYLAEAFAALPFSAVTIPAFSSTVLFLIYALLGFAYLVWKRYTEPSNERS